MLFKSLDKEYAGLAKILLMAGGA